MVGHDFGLYPQNSVLTLAASRNYAPAARALFPEAAIVSRRLGADAVLTRSPSAGAHRLTVRAGTLSAPPVLGRDRSASSCSLVSQGRSWATRVLDQPDWLTPAIATRARTVLDGLRDHRLGGTWWGRAPSPVVAGRAVVVADGTELATRRMLMQVVERHGAGRTVLVSRGWRRVSALAQRLGVMVLDGVVDPWPLAEEAASLHVGGNSTVGLIGRLIGTTLQVHSAGILERDVDPCRLTAAEFLLGTRYLDPFDGRPIACEAFLDRAIEWRRQMTGQAEIGCYVGISFWKRRRIRDMLGAGRRPAFRRTTRAALKVVQRRGGGIGAWASRIPAGLDRAAVSVERPIIRIEDGFIRSVGLGADFLPPMSIVLDRAGLYYDSTRASDLEALLAESRFGPRLIARAAALRTRIVTSGTTKYNLQGEAAEFAAPDGRRVILVPGQVADDRSVLLGGGGCRPGLDLLRAVRMAVPDGFIVYKPHPDVEAGYRMGGVADTDALEHVDAVVRGGSMAALLEKVDEVHTLTSLTGFEALLRGKPVTTYGQPFYAGWGLTHDHNPVVRRTRRLKLDELVAGVLILYPRYIDPVSLLPCGPETILDRLDDPTLVAGLQNVGWLVRARRVQGWVAAQTSQFMPGLGKTRKTRKAA